jgi:hypothetical protein
LPCVLFGPESDTAGVGGQALKVLVTQPLQNYSHLTGAGGYLTNHECAQYHKCSVARADAFLANKSKNDNIVKHIDSSARSQALVSRARLVPIVKTVLFCARANLPFRGHRDDGALITTAPDSNVDTPFALHESDANTFKNDGVFRALLRFRMDAGDSILGEHFKNAAKNATYISKTVQNELIKICGDIIRDKILSRIKGRQFPVFSIMADETTDVSTTEQMSIIYRYVDESPDNPKVPIIREDFVDFVPVYDLSGRALANKLMEYVTRTLGNGPCMVGQGYDGAAAMSGRLNGVQSIVRESSPMAIYVHCASHCLNLVLSSSCCLPSIRNAQATVSELAAFVGRSAGQTHLLKEVIRESTAVDTKRQKLQSLCETRWVERHDAILCFCELFDPIAVYLDRSKQTDKESAAKASTLLSAISHSDFLVSVAVLHQVLAITYPLSVSLQKSNIDLVAAMADIQAVRRAIQQLRTEAADAFPWAFAEELAESVGVTLSKPRIVGKGKQINRANATSDTAEEHYRINIYIPFLDHVLSQITERFTGHFNLVQQLSSIIPGFSGFKSVTDGFDVKAFSLYESLIDIDRLPHEIRSWKARWSDVDGKQLPANAIETLEQCNADFYPNVHKLLTILATLPVTTASAERSFSTLRRLKTYLKATMTSKRLNCYAS